MSSAKKEPDPKMTLKAKRLEALMQIEQEEEFSMLRERQQLQATIDGKKRLLEKSKSRSKSK